MSDFPVKAPDRTNAVAVVVIGLATTAVLWAFVVYLQSYFENTHGELAAKRASIGRSAMVRDLKAEQRADLVKTAYADAAKGTLKRLNLEHAKNLVVRDSKSSGSLIPSLGILNCPTIPAAAGRPADDSAINPCAPAPAPAAPAPDAESCDEAYCLANPDKPCCDPSAASGLTPTVAGPEAVPAPAPAQ